MAAVATGAGKSNYEPSRVVSTPALAVKVKAGWNIYKQSQCRIIIPRKFCREKFALDSMCRRNTSVPAQVGQKFLFKNKVLKAKSSAVTGAVRSSVGKMTATCNLYACETTMAKKGTPCAIRLSAQRLGEAATMHWSGRIGGHQATLTNRSQFPVAPAWNASVRSFSQRGDLLAPSRKHERTPSPSLTLGKHAVK